MERLKQMSLKKALFIIAFFYISLAFMLSLLAVWGLSLLRAPFDTVGIVINIASGAAIITETASPSGQAGALAEIISLIQLILPVVIYIIALAATALTFYRLKLKEPLKILTDGAARIIDNDLNFEVECKSRDELGRLCTAFETMRQTLLANNRELWRQAEERKRLNAAFSHNLRNPVTVLKGSAKLAQRGLAGNLPAEQLADNLALIENYTERIERYIETMSSIQRLEEIPIARESVQWDSLTAELEKLLRLMEAGSGKRLEFCAAAYAQDVWLDKAVLFQVAENLFANALRFAARDIKVACSVQGPLLELAVGDDGGGFPAELLQKGVQPFQKGRADAEHFGMGLYSCRLLCQRHGGGLALQNQAGSARVCASFNIQH